VADPSRTSAHKSGKKVANSLLSLSSAAVLVIYAAGYERTRSAAEELEAASAQRRPVVPSRQPAAAAPLPLVAPAEVSSPAAPTPEPTTAAAAPAVPAAAAPPDPAPPAPAPETMMARSETETAAVAKATVAAPKSSLAAAPAAASERPAAAPTVAPSAAPAAPTVAAAPAAPIVAPTAAPAATAAPAVAPAAAEPAAEKLAAPAAPPAAKYKDGTYRAWGRSRHGDIYSFVVVENGRIVHSGVDKCRTRWSCELVDHLGPQVVQRQSAEVDYVSGATESGNAFYYGVLEALKMAQGLMPVDPANDLK
jgi:uncharacterized protein with FMN-binding domain